MRWRAVIEKLAGSSDSPRRTAAAFALGTFLSFSPFIGFQIATGVAAAFLFRLSRPAVILGLCTNLPWFIIPWYTLTTLAGATLLGQRIPADFGARLTELMGLAFYRAEFWQRAYDLVAPFFWSFITGSTVGAAVVGTATFFVATAVLSHRLARHAQQ